MSITPAAHADLLHRTTPDHPAFAPFDPAPTPDRVDWFTQARLGVSYHWGLYSQPARGEWVRSIEELSPEQYRPYFETFEADRYDPARWAAAASAMGAGYAVLTAKHHDGFCLFDSDLTEYKATNTPAGRDLIREYTEAFRATGLRVGLYYSLVDWQHPDVPGFGDRQHPMRRDPSQQDRDAKAQWDRYLEYMHGQVRELLTNYGTIDLLIFDFSWYEYVGEKWKAQELVAMIRELQPDIVLNDRLSNAVSGNMKSANPPSWAGDFDTCELNIPHGLMLDARGQAVPWDLWITHGNSWSYSEDDPEIKDASAVTHALVNCVSKSGNLTFNFAPTARGDLIPEQIELQEQIGAWLELNAPSIQGCGAAPLARPDWGRWTLSNDGKTLYAHITEQPMGHLTLRGLRGKVRNPRLIASGADGIIGDFWNPGVQAFGEPEDIFLNWRRPISRTYRRPDSIDTVVAMDVVPAAEQADEAKRITVDPYQRVIF